MASLMNAQAMAGALRVPTECRSGSSRKKSSSCSVVVKAVTNAGGNLKARGLRTVAEKRIGLKSGSRDFAVVAAAMEGGNNSTMVQSASGDSQFGGDEFDKVRLVSSSRSVSNFFVSLGKLRVSWIS